MVNITQNQSIVSLFSSRTPSQAASTQATSAAKAANTTTAKSRPSFLAVLLRSLACFAA